MRFPTPSQLRRRVPPSSARPSTSRWPCLSTRWPRAAPAWTACRPADQGSSPKTARTSTPPKCSLACRGVCPSLCLALVRDASPGIARALHHVAWRKLLRGRVQLSGKTRSSLATGLGRCGEEAPGKRYGKCGLRRHPRRRGGDEIRLRAVRSMCKLFSSWLEKVAKPWKVALAPHVS